MEVMRKKTKIRSTHSTIAQLQNMRIETECGKHFSALNRQPTSEAQHVVDHPQVVGQNKKGDEEIEGDAEKGKGIEKTKDTTEDNHNENNDKNTEEKGIEGARKRIYNVDDAYTLDQTEDKEEEDTLEDTTDDDEKRKEAAELAADLTKRLEEEKEREAKIQMEIEERRRREAHRAKKEEEEGRQKRPKTPTSFMDW